MEWGSVHHHARSMEPIKSRRRCHCGCRTRVTHLGAQINELRRAIRSEGTPAIQDAWDKVEEHIDFAYGRAEGSDGSC